MSNSKIYQSITDGRQQNTPSYICALSNVKELLSIDEITKRLTTNSNIKVISSKQVSKGEYALSKRRLIVYDFELEYKGVQYPIKILNKNNSAPNLTPYVADASITADEKEEAAKLTNYLEVSLTFQKSTLNDFHLQLQVIKLLVPNGQFILDNSSKKMMSYKWLNSVTSTECLPSPNFLFLIRTVQEGDKYWIRTEGLSRCCAIELEIIDIKNGVYEMIGLLNNTALEFIYHMHKEDQQFQIGYDGLKIHLCWMRWENAVKKVGKEALGGEKNRIVEQLNINPYQGASGVIMGIEEGELTSPELYLSTLRENPTYIVQEEEINRISTLAKERFESFKAIAGKHQGDQENWVCLLQLAEVAPNNTIEHLWYKVEKIEGDLIEAVLINQPYWIEAKNYGDLHQITDISKLTNWAIYHDHQKYTPDTIYSLQ